MRLWVELRVIDVIAISILLATPLSTSNAAADPPTIPSTPVCLEELRWPSSVYTAPCRSYEYLRSAQSAKITDPIPVIVRSGLRPKLTKGPQ